MGARALVAATGLVIALAAAACGSNDEPLITEDWRIQVGSDAAETSFAVAGAPNGDVVVTASTEGDISVPNHGKRDIFLARYAPDGTQRWSTQVGGADVDSPLGVAIAPDGAIFLTGFTDGDFAGPNQGSADVVLAKFAASGEELWRTQFGGDQWDRGFDVVVSDDGVYVTGYTASVLDAATNNEGFDGFAAKFDSDGNQLWIRQLGSDATDWGQGSALAPDGGLYVTGYTEGDYGGPNLGDKDAFVVRLSADGEELWVRNFGSDKLDWTQGVGIGPDGGVLVAGSSEGGEPSDDSVSSKDMLFASFSADGDELFVLQLGMTGVETAFEIRSAGGQIVATGTTTSDAGDKDAALIYLDVNGDLITLDEFGTDQDDELTGLDLAPDGSIVYSGYTFGSLVGPSNGGSDVIVGALAPGDSDG